APFSYVGIFQNVSERHRTEKELHRLAFFDELTGLPNRRMFKEHVARVLSAATRQDSKCALCVLDLDGFKQVNDALGHSIGDLLLKQVSDRLAAEIRQYDVVSRQEPGETESGSAAFNLARFGGDEFLLLVSDFDHPSVPGKVASRILQSIAKPYNIHGHELNVTASVGVAQFPEDGDSLEVLLMHADSAMYEAKSIGKNSYSYYSTNTGKTSRDRLALEAELRKAPQNGELRLHYQPIIDSVAECIMGFEALLRWQHPERGLLSPASFINIAEETGLIVPIGEWVLGEVLRQMNEWTGTPLAGLKCAVNVSGLQLRQDEFLVGTKRLLDDSRFPANSLVFELTESAIMSSAQSRLDWLQGIKDLGVEVAIDDFGTGYSSLAYLKKFPIDYLKIDRSFVVDLARDADDQVIVSTMFSMAKALGLGIVAEGVEGPEQYRILTQMGNCAIQGYMFGEAMTPEELLAFTTRFEMPRQLAHTVGEASG
ncbi:MAG: EAL domain-containing protein, partial [Halioglobus sp.]|nr:EAL domain-containing protein [Halioglobus sp.]